MMFVRRPFLVALFLAVAAVLASPCGLSQDAPKMVALAPEATSEPLINPGMGWVFYQFDNANWFYGADTRVGDVLAWFPGASVIYFRIPWCEVEPEEGRFRWDVIDTYAQPWIASGRQVAFRFTCSESAYERAVPEWVQKAGARGSHYAFGQTGRRVWEPDYRDPVFLEKLEKFVAAAARRWDGNDVVAFMDVGSFGMWGEGHTGYTSKLNRELTGEIALEHARLFRRHFRRTPLVISDDVAGASSRDPDPSVMSELRRLGIGFRDDSIMVSARPNQWYHADWARRFAEAGLPVVVESAHFYNGRVDARTGEPCWYEGGLLDSTVAYRANYQAIHWWPDDFLKANVREIEAVNRRLGYRFELRCVVWPETVEGGRDFVISNGWVNVGVTTPLEECFVAWSLVDERDGLLWTCVDESSDFRTFSPTLEGGERPAAIQSRVRFGWDRLRSSKPRESLFRRHDGQALPAGDKVPSVPAGEYQLAVSLGRRDATPRIALPLRGQIGKSRRYVLGRIRIR